MNVSSLIKEHYKKKNVREIIVAHSSDGEFWRAGCGDKVHWYKKYVGKKDEQYLWDLSQKYNYDILTRNIRTLYWTLNFFQPSVRKQKRFEIDDEPSPGSFRTTKYYSLAIDIDCQFDITNDKARRATEEMVKYYVEELENTCKKSISVYFSGNGVYIFLHHRITGNKSIPEFSYAINAYNKFIENTQKSFYEKNHDLKKYVKADALNSQKRLFKSILSIHIRHPFCCIPIDSGHIFIDLKSATIPISDETIETARQWGTTYG